MELWHVRHAHRAGNNSMIVDLAGREDARPGVSARSARSSGDAPTAS